jgi:carbon-monoxide dehydrogenase medium subunit
VKPTPYAYHAPDSLEEALAVRAELGGDSALLAGGQSLIPLLNLRLAAPAAVIDLGKVAELRGIRPADGWISVGAMTRQRELECSEIVLRKAPVIAESLAHVGHVTIRNRGTVGGSIAHADPAAELPAVALLLDAELVALSVRGERLIPARDFFCGVFTTALKSDELLVEVRLPEPPTGSRSAFVEIARQKGAFALAGAGALVTIDSDGTIVEARLAFIAAGATAVRAAAAEEALRGLRASEQAFREVAEVAASDLEPMSDIHGTAHYRRRIAAVAARRALVAATMVASA